METQLTEEQVERLVVLELVRNLMDNCPKLNKQDLMMTMYNSRDNCPEWAINEIYLERGIAVEEKEKQEDKAIEALQKEIYFLLLAEKRDEATEAMVQYVLKEHHIFTIKDDDKPEMFMYSQGIYVRNAETTIRQILRRLLMQVYKESIVVQVVKKLQADTYIEYDLFMKRDNNNEVPVLNGILNVLTLELKPFTPYKRFFNKCPVVYDPGKKCPHIDKFLGDILSNPDDRKVYYEIGGYSLIDEYLFEKAFMFHGDGRNGKGKSLELIKRVVGAENCYSLPLSSLESNNPNIWQIHNKKINLAGDISNNDLKDTGLFKSMTGRDQITVPRKYHPSFTFVNSAKFVFACNELPMVYDTSVGFWDRWVLLDFPYRFQPQEEFDILGKDVPSNWKLREEGIIDRIATSDELSGLLNAFLEGLQRLLKQRHFSSTVGSEDIKNLWIRKANSFMAFCFDFLDEAYDGKIDKRELRAKYSKYCKKYKLKGKSDIVIKIALQEVFGADEDSSYESMSNKQTRCWTGIKWKDGVKL